MNCEKCRWRRTSYAIICSNVWATKVECLLGGCDGSQYEPKDGKDEVEE